MQADRVIGVDLGGTKILAGLVGRDGDLGRQVADPTPIASEAGLLAALDAAVEELLGDGAGALGFGVPSRLDRHGRLQGSVNIPLQEFDLRRRMQERFAIPVAIDNDANAAAFAEWRIGAGRETQNMVMLTLGTGCGGGVVIDGRPYRGWAEFGHIVIDFDGIECQGTCTGRGHLEPYVTGLAATRLARHAFGPQADSRLLVHLASEGDEKARGVLAGVGRRLGAGIATLVNIFNPELVVIGGGFAAALEFLLEPAREVLTRDALSPAGEVPIVRAELGPEAGLIGAGLIAFDALEGA